MVTRTRVDESITLTEHDLAAVEQLGRLLENGSLDKARLLSADGRTLDIPEPIGKALGQIIMLLARGEAVAVVPAHEELSTFEAAALLHVSRPHVIKLLEAGEIPYHLVGAHRRIYRKDVLAYIKWRHKEDLQLLDEMAAIAQEAGAYD